MGMQTENQTFMGWENRDTWLVHLNLCNSQMGSILYNASKSVEEIKEVWDLCGDLLWDKVDMEQVKWDELANFLLKTEGRKVH